MKMYKEDQEIPIIPVKTGTILDNLFYKYENGKIKTLGGIPKYNLLLLTGTNGTGKSLLSQQITNNISQKEKVIYITSEVPASFIFSSLKRLPNFNRENIIILDAQDTIYDIDKTLNELISIIKETKAKFLVIDSITAFYEHLENKARIIVRKMYNTLKKFYITGIFINQKRSSHEENSSEGAGGYAVAHILDGTIVMIKKIIEKKWDEEFYSTEKGKMIRIIRIDDCRTTLHSTKEHIFKINPDGSFEIIKEKERE